MNVAVIFYNICFKDSKDVSSHPTLLKTDLSQTVAEFCKVNRLLNKVVLK